MSLPLPPSPRSAHLCIPPRRSSPVHRLGSGPPAETRCALIATRLSPPKWPATVTRQSPYLPQCHHAQNRVQPVDRACPRTPELPNATRPSRSRKSRALPAGCAASCMQNS
ncbi:hypothetical protein C8R44DRAFT_805301 [Mycena epipterygia]|nr:hypothetical protein C8R44DRAFT_805301 [Mycena epipterygia]